MDRAEDRKRGEGRGACGGGVGSSWATHLRVLKSGRTAIKQTDWKITTSSITVDTEIYRQNDHTVALATKYLTPVPRTRVFRSSFKHISWATNDYQAILWKGQSASVLMRGRPISIQNNCAIILRAVTLLRLTREKKTNDKPTKLLKEVTYWPVTVL